MPFFFSVAVALCWNVLGGGKKKCRVPVVYVMKSTPPCPKPCLAFTEQTTATKTHNKCCMAGTTSNAEAFSFCRERKSVEHAIITNTTSKMGSRRATIEDASRAVHTYSHYDMTCRRTPLTMWKTQATKAGHHWGGPIIFVFGLHVDAGKTSHAFRTGVCRGPLGGRSVLHICTTPTGQGHVL